MNSGRMVIPVVFAMPMFLVSRRSQVIRSAKIDSGKCRNLSLRLRLLLRGQHLEIHMSMKYMAAALLASSLLSVPAFAQSAQKSDPTAAAQTAAQTQGTWRTSKMISLNVYNNNNEKVGDINELITDPSGKIDSVVIGVGGFLGMGERNVGVAWSQLKFVME